MLELNLKQIFDLFYQSKSNSQVADFLNFLGHNYKVSKHSQQYYQIYSEIGIELVFTNEHYFTNIFVHNGYEKKCKVELPFDLDINMNMEQVEQVMGVPEIAHDGTQRLNSWTSYQDKGVFINYRSRSKDDLKALIDSIGIKKPLDEIGQLKMLVNSEIHVYFQASSKSYSHQLLTDIFKEEPTRFEENEVNLYEVYLTNNPRLSIKSQIRNAFIFIDKKSDIIKNLRQQVSIQLKININAYSGTSINFKLTPEQVEKLQNLGMGIEFDFCR